MLRSRAARTKLRWTWRRGTGMNGLPEYFGATLKRDENGDRNSHTGIEIDIPCTNGCKSIVRKGVNYELCIIPSCVLFSNPLRYAKNIFLCTTPTYFPPSTIQRYRNPNFENNSNTSSIGAFRLNAIGPCCQKSRLREALDRYKVVNPFAGEADSSRQRNIHRRYSRAGDLAYTTRSHLRFDLLLAEMPRGKPNAYSSSLAEMYPTKTPLLIIGNPPSRPPIPFNHSTFSLNPPAAISFPPVMSMTLRSSSD